MIKQFVKDNFLVLLLYLLLLFTALFFILNYEKVSINVYLNQLVGNPFFNGFFYWITYLGDGNVAFLILFIIFLYNIRLGICATLSFITAALVSNSLKYFLFDEVNRPAFIYRYIEKQHAIKYVEGVDLHIHNSFPSGHATQAFAILKSIMMTITSWLRGPVMTSHLISMLFDFMFSMLFHILFVSIVLFFIENRPELFIVIIS